MDVTRPHVFVAFDIELLATSLVGYECRTTTIDTILAECDIVRANGSLYQRARGEVYYDVCGLVRCSNIIEDSQGVLPL
jgi:hypothetical protein